MSESKKYMYGIIIYIILYVISLFLLISFIAYTHEYKYFLFYFFTLILNLLLIIIKHKDKRFFLFSLILNFYCGIFYFIFVNWNYFFLSSFTEKISYFLFSFLKVIISCNWSLPILYVLVTKAIMNKRKRQ